jgi:uncharacterized protein YciI
MTMRYALICIDKPNALQTRVDNRAAHLEYIKDLEWSSRRGPSSTRRGRCAAACWSWMSLSKAEAEAWAAADPYAKAGLFQSVMIQEWKRVIG